jgi:hypothetical protein
VTKIYNIAIAIDDRTKQGLIQFIFSWRKEKFEFLIFVKGAFRRANFAKREIQFSTHYCFQRWSLSNSVISAEYSFSNQKCV